MPVNFFPAQFEVIRDTNKCIKCRACERQCSNEVHFYDADYDKMLTHDSQCVDCQRCVCICPTGALKIRKNENEFRESANYTQQIMIENYRQAGVEAAVILLYIVAHIERVRADKAADAPGRELRVHISADDCSKYRVSHYLTCRPAEMLEVAAGKADGHFL